MQDVSNETEDSLNLEEYIDWALKNQGEQYNDHITKKLKKFLEREQNRHISLDVTSPGR